MEVKVKKIKHGTEEFNKCKELLKQTLPYAQILPTDVILAAYCNEELIGMTSYRKLSWFMSESSHTLVKEEFRGYGVGSRLMSEKLRRIETPFTYATIVANNFASLKMAKKQGGVIVDGCSFPSGTVCGEKVLLVVYSKNKT